MKYLKQFGIIILISFIGEILNYYIPLPIPASIYGLLIMLFLLLSGILKLQNVQCCAKFLIDVMPVMFIPAGVGLMVKWADLQSFLVPIAVITVVSTIVVMAVTGTTAQFLINRQSKKDIKKQNKVDKNA